jgi:aminopeptidase N
MMFAGDFAIVKDSWKRKDGKTIEVNYYLEKDYESHARAIFGKTPRMIQYFSDLLGVEYPWEKYHQVIVRDFVSGAMENTTAVINGDFYYQTTREIIDGSNESTIAHELFHHWFGDLVTCESWANLPLNESFANYSQYLWDEFEYDRFEADKNAFGEMEGYMISSQQQGFVNMIRFDYANKEDMFDAHSYNKGGRILHMLRTYLGDEAFFKSLQLYLSRHQYKSAEIHDLRLAFEEVSGQDLNWFFNQWFLDKGHPKMNYSHSWNEATKQLTVNIEQQQNFDKVPLYKLLIDIDVYIDGKAQRKRVWAETVKAQFTFDLSQKPQLVNFDATKTLLCKKTDEKTEEEWLELLKHGPLYLDKREAIEQLKNASNAEVHQALIQALDHPFWHIKVLAMGALKKATAQNENKVKSKLSELALKDKHPAMRSNAIKYLNRYFEEDASLNETYKQALNDSSYQVMSTSLEILYEKEPKTALALARKHQDEKSGTLQSTIAKIYADEGNPADYDFFMAAIKNASGFSKFGVLQAYSRYLVKQDNEVMMRGAAVFTEVVNSGGPWFIRLSGYQLLSNLENKFNDHSKEWKTKSESFEKENKPAESADALRESNTAKGYAEQVKKILDELKAKETDKMVKQYLGRT